MLGQTIDGKYQIVRLLGQGGMGAVYEASHSGTGRRVALKVIIPGALISRDAILRFQREARAAGVIESQHIVQVLDTGIDREQGVPFMVMEYLVGEDLQKLGERLGALAPELALRIGAQACSGLQKAHEARVIHRDIKPANLFLARRDDADVVVKILDFGIAKVKEDQLTGAPDQALTRTGGMMGSPLYMSPEQAVGSKAIDHRTDVWSLGAVLYEVLTGRSPHHSAQTLGQLIMAICSAPPLPLTQVAPSVPREVGEIVQRALRIDPNERFQSAAEMRDAIRQLLPSGTNVTESMLVPAPATLSTSQPVLGAVATSAPAQSTAEPFTRTAPKPAGKGPLVALGLLTGAGAVGAAFGFMSNRTDGSTSSADASAHASALPVATVMATAAAEATPEPLPSTTAMPTPSASAAPAVAATNQASNGKSGSAMVAVKSATAAASAAVAAPAPAAPAPAAAPAPKPPAPKPTGLTVDRNFE
ncbi:MAG TPA: serine/threonine-protein kinase [Polyangiaceae bacterium]|nr:serine/threonine-protein kinase [Polyangiaceae bacterium]